MGDRTLDYIALVILCCVVLTIIYGVIYIHDIPYEMAKKRNHPHQDAIHTAGWVSLFLMHTIWPFLWIWATLYKPGVGWGVGAQNQQSTTANNQEPLVTQLNTRVEQLENQLQNMQKEHLSLLEQWNSSLSKLEQDLSQKKGE